MDPTTRMCWPRYGRVDAQVGIRGSQEEPLSCMHAITEFRMTPPRLRRKKVLVQETPNKIVARKAKMVIRKRNYEALSERVSLTQKDYYYNDRDDDDMPLLNWKEMAGPQKHGQTRAWM